MTDPSAANPTTSPGAAAPGADPRGVAAVTRLLPRHQPPAVRPALEGNLALATPAGRTARTRPTRPDLRLVDGEQAHTKAWALRFFQVLVEILGGDRSPHQLLRSTSHEVFTDLARRSEILNRVAGTGHRKRLRAQVRSVHVCQPSALVAEVCARVEHGGRSRAVAGRLELVDGRWRCTALEFG